MGVLSENDNQNELEQDEQELIDTFLQNEYLMLNNQLKDKIRDLLNDEKIKLEPKELQTLIQTLNEAYNFDRNLKSNIHHKVKDAMEYELEHEKGHENLYRLECWEKWKAKHDARREY